MQRQFPKIEPGQGDTNVFAGRDVMAPAAGFLAAGVPLDDLGEAVDPISLTPGMLPVADIDGETVRAEVWWVDRLDRKSTRLNSSHTDISRMPSSA